MSKESKNEGKGGAREIKQVYLSDDGSEETSVTSAIINEDEGTGEKPKAAPGHGHANHSVHHAGHHRRRNNRALWIVAIALVMVFSLFLAMTVGVGLALWDSDRSLSELGMIVFAREMPAKTPNASDTSDGSDNADDNSLDEVPEDGPLQESVTEDTPVEQNASTVAQEDDAAAEDAEAGEEDDYGATIASDTDGLTGVFKAGSDDEINRKDEEETDTPKDPITDYPVPFSTVDESYFTDALFIGDSRLQGFGFWSGLPATFYCATGFQLYKYDTTKVVQTENGKVPIFDAMPYDAFTKIYIKVGLNELGYGTEENFEKKYAELIAKLREYEPRAVIYVHALLPVTAEKSATDKAHNNPNIVARNTALKEFATEQKAYFLDAGPVLSTSDGSLRPEMTTDGIHLKAEYMKIWRQYLCEHAVVLK